MRLVLIACLFFILTNLSYGQDMGMSMSFSTEKVATMDLFYSVGVHRFHLGGGVQFNGQGFNGIQTNEPEPNFPVIDNGEFIMILNLGYSRILNNKLTVHPVVSLGRQQEYVIFDDDSINDGEYFWARGTDVKIGAGLNIGYFISKRIEPFIGYHTLSGFNFGSRYTFSK